MLNLEGRNEISILSHWYRSNSNTHIDSDAIYIYM